MYIQIKESVNIRTGSIFRCDWSLCTVSNRRPDADGIENMFSLILHDSNFSGGFLRIIIFLKIFLSTQWRLLRWKTYKNGRSNASSEMRRENADARKYFRCLSSKSQSISNQYLINYIREQMSSTISGANEMPSRAL